MKNVNFIFLLLFFQLNSFSQTVNIGDLYISPGTEFSSTDELNNTSSGSLINDGELILYKHFNNDGLTTFTSGLSSGKTKMWGDSSFQNISGLLPIECYDIEFNNTFIQPAFHLSNDIIVYGNSNFLNGIIDNINYNGLFVFEKYASHSNTSDVSHVDGFVQKNGSDAFRFPVGNGGKYVYNGISAPDLDTDAFTSRYYLQNSNSLYPHTSKEGVIELIDNAEYWTLERTTGTSNVFLTLSWNTATTPSAIYASPTEDIHIVRWDSDQNLWVDEGGVANLEQKEVSMIISPLENYGIFTLARVKTNEILPCGGNGIVVYNALSPNDDGNNDFFKIDGIENCINNRVSIFNRWGGLVYQTAAYNTLNNVFRGYSEGNLLLNSTDKLPVGTYFYIIEFLDEFERIKFKKAGYLYLNE